jgi:hypothetical protein
MGRLTVEYLRPGSGNSLTDTATATVDMITPFYGVTGVDYVGEDPDDYNNTQKSYGMWFVPPDIGTTVLVIFVNNDPKKGYWLGCVPDQLMNFMVPGIAATSYVVEDSKTVEADRLPVAEFNKKINEEFGGDPTKIKKPQHPFAEVLDQQGLLKDDVRGITTSSARRETPSMVFGISTPGPVDKQTGAKKGPRGTKESLSPNTFVSRLGGTTFVMDDGDDKFLRKTPASEGPPEYASVENNETDGDVTIPHNELVRIRTRTGHQILLHNSEDLIYIGNARGTTWIEMTSNGKIDIYAQDSISIHTENDINVTADRDINFTAANDVNINAGNNINQQAGAEYNVKSGGAAKINPGGNFVVLAAGTDIDGGNINLNSGGASAASPAPKATRIPQAEPWSEHENTDPTKFTADQTQAKESPEAAAEAKGTYSTATDTFAKEFAADPEDQEEEEGGQEL